jgi:chromosome segregation ATPase
LGDPDAIRARALAAQGEYSQAANELTMARTAVKELKSALSVRVKQYAVFRNSTTTTAKSQFAAMLNKRGFAGELMINHGLEEVEMDKLSPNMKGTLSIRVQPATATSAREAATLSGGEKSFSQICLLLALWETMHTRLRCLDEFDVFMDSVNRAQSMKMLSEYASKSRDVQFIFISPQDSSLVAGMGESVRCVRMPDPVRGNQTRIHDHFQ